MSRVLRVAAAFAAVSVAVLAGSASASAPPTPLTKRCGRTVGGTTLWFKAADGVTLDGAVLGKGRTGVVLATEYPAELCNWLPEALVLQQRGFRVFLFDFRGFGLSTQPPASKQRHFVEDVIGAAALALHHARDRPPRGRALGLEGHPDVDPQTVAHRARAVAGARALDVDGRRRGRSRGAGGGAAVATGGERERREEQPSAGGG